MLVKNAEDKVRGEKLMAMFTSSGSSSSDGRKLN
jgi:hypothetical protein